MPENKIKFNPKAVIDDMKNSQRKTFVFSLNLALICLVVFALAFFFGRSLLFILVPFVLLPWIFASILMVMDKQANDLSAPSLFLASFSLFYRQNMFGSYRIIRNYLISWAISLIVSLLTGVIYYYASSNPELEKLVSQAYFYLSNGNTNMLNGLLSTESALTKMIEIISATQLASFFLIFVHEMSVYGLNAMMMVVSIRDRNMNRLFTKAMKANWKEFFKMYYGMIYPLLIIWLICGVGGYFLSTLIDGLYLEQRVIFAIGFGLSLASLGFGYYVHAIHLMQGVYGKMAFDYVMRISEETMNDPRFMDELNEDERKSFKEQIDQIKKIVNDEKNSCDSDEPDDNGGMESEDKNDENQ